MFAFEGRESCRVPGALGKIVVDMESEVSEIVKVKGFAVEVLEFVHV